MAAMFPLLKPGYAVAMGSPEHLGGRDQCAHTAPSPIITQLSFPQATALINN